MDKYAAENTARIAELGKKLNADNDRFQAEDTISASRAEVANLALFKNLIKSGAMFQKDLHSREWTEQFYVPTYVDQGSLLASLSLFTEGKDYKAPDRAADGTIITIWI